MLAIWCLAVPMLSMLLIGAPLRALLARGKLLDECGWVQVPFVGIAATVLILQVELQLDVRISRGVIGLWAAAALLWLVWLWHGGVLASFRSIPVLPFAVATVVLGVQAAGLIVLGTNDYVGRGWCDQFNYTTMAECFRRQGFAFTLQDLGQRPWLVRVLGLKEYRIGQSVLQAYHGVIAMTDTRKLFMPTILLASPLNALALYVAALTVGLRRRQAAMAGLLGGLVPGVTLLAQECFLSHALGMPWLLLLPTLLTRYLMQRDVGSWAIAALALGALASIYPEFLIFALILVAVFSALALVQRRRHWGHFLGFAILVAAPWLLNPLQARLLWYLSPGYLATAAGLAHIYPWAYGPEGLPVIWMGDSYFLISDTRYQLGGMGLAFAIAGGGTLGLLALLLDKWGRWRRGGRRASDAEFALPLALLGLVAIPLLIAVPDEDHSYQFFKMLITVSPLHALGAVTLGTLAAKFGRGVPRQVAQGLIGSLVLVGLVVAGLGSYELVMQTTRPEVFEHRFLGFRLQQQAVLNDDFRELRHHLENLRGHSILLRPAGLIPRYSTLWACYFGRFNQLWLTDSAFNDGIDLLQTPGLTHLADLSRVPADCLVLTPRRTMLMQPPRSLPASALVRQGVHYTIWKLEQRPWAGIVDFKCPIGQDPANLWWLWLTDEETTFRVFASETGFVNLTVSLSVKPLVDAPDNLHLHVKDSRGTVSIVQCPPGKVALPIFLPRGISIVTIKLSPATEPVGLQILDFEYPSASDPASVGP